MYTIQRLSVKSRMILFYTLVFTFLLLLVESVIYLKVKASIRDHVEKQLNNSNESIYNLVSTTAKLEVRNRLSTVASNCRNTALAYLDIYESGKISEEDMYSNIFESFRNTEVGYNGYITCLDKSGTAIFHPDPHIRNTDLTGFAFIRDLLDKEGGYFEYEWGENKHKKALHSIRLEKLDLYILVTIPREYFDNLIERNDLSETLQAFAYTGNGFPFILDQKGTYLIHPVHKGKDLAHLGRSGKQLKNNMFQMKQGSIEHCPPGESTGLMLTAFNYLPEYGWFVGSSVNLDAAFKALASYRILFIIVGFAGILLFAFTSLLISSSIVNPLNHMAKELEKGSSGNFTVRMNIKRQDEIGKLACYFNTFMERLDTYKEQLSDEIQRHKQLRQRAALLAAAVEQAAEIVVITDVEGVIEYVNPSFEKLTGFSRAEAIGSKPSILKSGKHDTGFYSELWGTISIGGIWQGRFINQNKNGELYHEEATIFPLRDAFGKITNYVSVKRDITRETEIEDQLRQSQKLEAIGSLAGGIAHDFNNILTAIIGYSEMTLMDIEEEGELQDNLTHVLSAAYRARELVGQILTFSRQRKQEKQPVDINLIVKEVVKLLRASLPSTIEMFHNLPESSSVTMADPTQIHQILMNLCTNAHHAMKDNGGLLAITVSHNEIDKTDAEALEVFPGNFIRISVSDTGCGMDEETLKRIFDPFFTTKEQGEGTGLGLSVVHGIVKASRGSLNVKSNAGKGTTFEILLPREQAPDITLKTAVNRILPTGTAHLLVVDDEEFLREISHDMLESLGYRITLASSGMEALEILKKCGNCFDAVITDQIMPGMTGLKLAEQLRTLYPNLPIMMCTGFTGTITPLQAKSAGIKELLLKPYNKRELAEAVEKLFTN